MSAPIVIYSDPHYHNFQQFAHVNAKGVNTRLATTIRSTMEMTEHAKRIGAKTIICAGDIFHVRGAVAPSVLNPTRAMFKAMSREVSSVLLLTGNHDLESDKSKDLTAATHGVSGDGIVVVAQEEGVRISNYLVDRPEIVMIPWSPDLSYIRKRIQTDCKNPGRDILVLHAPMNGVITGLPDHGLTVDDFEGSGWATVFIGHYHNHRVFHTRSGTRVVSVGALTHQNWGDAESLAGYVVYYPDTNTIEHFETSAPKFVKVHVDDLDEFDPTDNFVKVVGGISRSDADDVRADLILRGAKGVIIEGIAHRPAVTRGASTSAGAPTIQSVLSDYVARTYPGDGDTLREALDILGEVYD